MRVRRALVLVALLAAPADAATLTVRGTSFVVTTDDGRTLTSIDLVGARLSVDVAGTPATLVIGAVEQDPVGGPDVLLHSFTVDAGAGAQEFCSPDPDGRRLGFPLEGADGGWTLACTSGAVGKCVRFGYRPWDPTRAPYHAACVHLLRADYCGDGHPTTRDGTLVNLYDRRGIQRRDAAPALTFEAAFGPDGAVCIARPRIAGTDLGSEVARCPRLAAVPRGPACTKATSDAMPEPLVFVDSAPPQPRRDANRSAS